MDTFRLVPAVITDTFEEMQERLCVANQFADRVHLDIMDGLFVATQSFHNAAQIATLSCPVELEEHLMVFKPDRAIQDWLKTPAQRIIVHFESSHKLDDVFRAIAAAGKKGFVALNPGTPVEFLETIQEPIDGVLAMTVHPGSYGNPFIPEVLTKIQEIKTKYPQWEVGIDGGISPETLPQVLDAGVRWIVSGSAIFKDPAKSPQEAYAALKEIAAQYLQQRA